MGTRNLTMVLLDGEIVVAQYGQWDGYPQGQGKHVVNFIKGMKKDIFIKRLKNIEHVDEEYIDMLWEGIGVSGEFASWGKSELFRKLYPEFHRSIAAEILDLIYFKKTTKLFLNTSFAQDSLSCEWAYLIDLDNDILEVYCGFNKKPLTKEDRFYTGNPPDRQGYYPIKLIWKGSFDEMDEIFNLEG